MVCLVFLPIVAISQAWISITIPPWLHMCGLCQKPRSGSLCDIFHSQTLIWLMYYGLCLINHFISLACSNLKSWFSLAWSSDLTSMPWLFLLICGPRSRDKILKSHLAGNEHLKYEFFLCMILEFFSQWILLEFSD